jgi:hypothetical protein
MEPSPMPFDYVAAFPLRADLIPERLRNLLMPVGLNPREAIEVARMYETPDRDVNEEVLYLQMAVVQDGSDAPLDVLNEAGQGVVAYSVPFDGRGNAAECQPSLSGHDYIVASWGSGSFYTYHLAEKVWMTLGLTPRCIGNDHQRLIYDDLGLPDFGVAQGEISNEYFWRATRNIHWSMSNEYLRKYLWLRSARGVRAIYYKKKLPDHPEIRRLMGAEKHIDLKPEAGPAWYNLDIREYKNGLLLQVWASVEAVSCELCPEQSADGIVWPEDTESMTSECANALASWKPVFLDDRFLERYEQSAFYDTTPVRIGGVWHCSPSYKGQWGFTDCIRVGRNLVRVAMRDLYKPKPDREILHAYEHALGRDEIAHMDMDAEHIVAKTQRFLDQIIILGYNLSHLGASTGLKKTAEELTGFSRKELDDNGWMAYQNLCKLAQVAPLDMTQQAFLSRCKQLHEILQKVPNGYLKSLLEKAGCPRSKVNDLGLLKLLEALLNVVQRLNDDEDSLDAFGSQREPEGWNARNTLVASLFLNNDLRIADAHEAVGRCIQTLQDMGFDTGHLNDGYGLALDFVMDGVIRALEAINSAMEQLLGRQRR